MAEGSGRVGAAVSGGREEGGTSVSSCRIHMCKDLWSSVYLALVGYRPPQSNVR